MKNISIAILAITAIMFLTLYMQSRQQAVQLSQANSKLDSTVHYMMAAASVPPPVTCSCDNSARMNVPAGGTLGGGISADTATAHGYVKAFYGTDHNKWRGGWFSKSAIDNIFCRKPDANGIYVYMGKRGTANVMVMEPERRDKILIVDNSANWTYYSETMCPTDCGNCGQ